MLSIGELVAFFLRGEVGRFHPGHAVFVFHYLEWVGGWMGWGKCINGVGATLPTLQASGWERGVGGWVGGWVGWFLYLEVGGGHVDGQAAVFSSFSSSSSSGLVGVAFFCLHLLEFGFVVDVQGEFHGAAGAVLVAVAIPHV